MIAAEPTDGCPAPGAGEGRRRAARQEFDLLLLTSVRGPRGLRPIGPRGLGKKWFHEYFQTPREEQVFS